MKRHLSPHSSEDRSSVDTTCATAQKDERQQTTAEHHSFLHTIRKTINAVKTSAQETLQKKFPDSKPMADTIEEHGQNVLAKQTEPSGNESRNDLLTMVQNVKTSLECVKEQLPDSQALIRITTDYIQKMLNISDGEFREIVELSKEDIESAYSLSSLSSFQEERLAQLTKYYTYVEGQKYTYKVLNFDYLQAFAVPDGTIYISSKILNEFQYGELLFIIGHEIGHIINGDAKQRFIRLKAVEHVLSLQNAFVRDKLLNGEDTNLLSILQYLIYDHVLENYFRLPPHIIECFFQRQCEYRADLHGFKTVQQAGLPPDIAIRTLKKLATQENFERSSFYESLLMTHPATKNRWKALEQYSSEIQNLS